MRFNCHKGAGDRERQPQQGAAADLAAYADAEFASEMQPQENVSRDRETIKVLIRKHRNGPIGTTELDFLKHYVTFRSRDPYLGQAPAKSI